MEAVATQSNEVFQPVTVEMILETQEELDALAVFCNYTPMTDAAKALGVDIRPIYDVLIKSGYDVTKWYSQVGPATQALLDHPALRGKVKEGSTKSVKKETESVPNYILD